MKNIFKILGVLLFVSCNSIKGKIEYRKDNMDCYGIGQNKYIGVEIQPSEYRDKDFETKSAYLINESADKSYEFTVKVVETIDDTITNSHTEKIKLSPGDEAWLGCTKFLNGERFYTHEVIDTFYWDNSNGLLNKNIARISKKTIVDSTSPKKRIIVATKYLCTGQRLITNPKELDSK